MSFKVTTRVEGGKETLKTLRKLDPEARKQFTKDAKRIAAPIVDEAKIAYPQQMLSGMKHKWTDRGRELFPYDSAAARRGVTVKIDTRARSKSLIKVIQKNPAASIIETAGAKTPSNFERQLTLKLGRRPSRVMWPAAEKNLTKVSGEMEASLKEVEREIERLLR
jgi:hypothetical protein